MSYFLICLSVTCALPWTIGANALAIIWQKMWIIVNPLRRLPVMYLSTPVRVFLKTPFVIRLNLPKSFRLFSKGLGATYISRMRAFHTYSTCPLGLIRQKVSALKGLCHYAVGYLDEVLARKYVQVNGYKYHMPRYYADKIFKKEIPLGIVDGSKKKIMVKTSLSVALANRAWMLRCERDNAARIANSMDGHSGFEKTALSEAISLLERDSKAKQSLFRFYQFARV